MPKSLACIALQARSYIGGRRSRGPIASCQSQFDRKLPPGSRQNPELSVFRIATVSARQPSMLSAGISDTTPTRKWPVPVPVMVNFASSVWRPAT